MFSLGRSVQKVCGWELAGVWIFVSVMVGLYCQLDWNHPGDASLCTCVRFSWAGMTRHQRKWHHPSGPDWRKSMNRVQLAPSLLSDWRPSMTSSSRALCQSFWKTVSPLKKWDKMNPFLKLLLLNILSQKRSQQCNVVPWFTHWTLTSK